MEPDTHPFFLSPFSLRGLIRLFPLPLCSLLGFLLDAVLFFYPLHLLQLLRGWTCKINLHHSLFSHKLLKEAKSCRWACSNINGLLWLDAAHQVKWYFLSNFSYKNCHFSSFTILNFRFWDKCQVFFSGIVKKTWSNSSLYTCIRTMSACSSNCNWQNLLI